MIRSRFGDEHKVVRDRRTPETCGLRHRKESTSQLSRRDLLRAGAATAAVAVPVVTLAGSGTGFAAPPVPNAARRRRRRRGLRAGARRSPGGGRVGRRADDGPRQRRAARSGLDPARDERDRGRGPRRWSDHRPGEVPHQGLRSTDVIAPRKHPRSPDPVADSTDLYAFVSPDRPGHGHDHRQLHPAARIRSAVRTSTSSATTSCTGSTSTTTATAARRSSTSSAFRDRGRQPGQTFLYNTGPDRQPSTAPTGTAGSSTRSPRSAGERSRLLGQDLPVPTVQHRTAFDAQLRRRSPRGDPQGRRRTSRCSPGSDSTRSTSTSARSSTSAICARSSKVHLVSTPPATRGQRARRRSTSTRSRSRSRHR